jgi:hypothetical protein
MRFDDNPNYIYSYGSYVGCCFVNSKSVGYFFLTLTPNFKKSSTIQ